MATNRLKPGPSTTRALRRRLRMWLDLAKVLSYDAQRFIQQSGVRRKTSHPPALAALITKQYHRIEKGLALPEPRPGFGESGIKELCVLVQEAVDRQICGNEVTLAVGALIGYTEFNLRHGIAQPTWIEAAVRAAADAGIVPSGSPTKNSACLADSATGHAGVDMIISRVSVRNFSQADVPDDVLERAVRAAQHAPCVCNRQAGRVHLIRDPSFKKVALAHQNGNRGFGQTAAVIAVVTADQSEMLEATERYQHWIDGGMFAQNFLLGVHAQGYGACPLNWSSSTAKDRSIRSALPFLGPSESIIMLIAVGSLKEDYQVARSARRPLSEVMKIV